MQYGWLRRREFFTLLGGAAAWPIAARAQQPAKSPTIGFLGASPWIESHRVAAFVQRLRELAWIDGHNLAIEYRWAEGRNEQYMEAAAGLVRLKVVYGPSVPDQFRRVADIVDKILRGAKPADIPVEQPTKFDLAINLTTAKVLGLKVPEAFLLRADEVIE